MRRRIAFRSVNRREHPDYDAGLQRHHLLPRQLLSQRCFGTMFARIGIEHTGFDDFRANGLLLPTSEAASIRIGLPLHRGPHRAYTGLVIERVGRIEAVWSAETARSPEAAIEQALMRLGLLQRALRRRLLDSARARLSLCRYDPLGAGVDFAELDAMAELLWAASEPDQLPILAPSSIFAA